MVAYWYERDVRKQRFRVRYWVVIYKFPFLFNIAEKNLFIVKLSVAKMASTVKKRKTAAPIILKLK